jgi:hypothetical protein
MYTGTLVLSDYRAVAIELYFFSAILNLSDSQKTSGCPPLGVIERERQTDISTPPPPPPSQLQRAGRDIFVHVGSRGRGMCWEQCLTRGEGSCNTTLLLFVTERSTLHIQYCPVSPEKGDPSARELLRRADSTWPCVSDLLRFIRPKAGNAP